MSTVDDRFSDYIKYRADFVSAQKVGMGRKTAFSFVLSINSLQWDDMDKLQQSSFIAAANDTYKEEEL